MEEGTDPLLVKFADSARKVRTRTSHGGNSSGQLGGYYGSRHGYDVGFF